MTTTSPANGNFASGLASPRPVRVLSRHVILAIDPGCNAPTPATTRLRHDAMPHLGSSHSPSAGVSTIQGIGQTISCTGSSNVTPIMHDTPSNTDNTNLVAGQLPQYPPPARIMRDTIFTGVEPSRSLLPNAAFDDTLHSPAPNTTAASPIRAPSPPDQETIALAIRWFKRTRRLTSRTQILSVLSDFTEIGRSVKEIREGLAHGDHAKMVFNASSIVLKLLSIPLTTSKTFYDLRLERLHFTVGNADPGLPTVEPTPLYLRCLAH